MAHLLRCIADVLQDDTNGSVNAMIKFVVADIFIFKVRLKDDTLIKPELGLDSLVVDNGRLESEVVPDVAIDCIESDVASLN